MKKKIIFTSALALTSVLALASCDEDKSTVGLEKAYSELKEGKAVTFEFWHSFGDAVTAPLEELVTNFQTEMKDKGFNITVNVVSKGGGYDGLRSSINLGAESGSIPTLVLGYPDHFADYIKQGILQPLDSYVYNSDSEIALDGVTSSSNDFITSYWNEVLMTMNSEIKVAGIPFNKSTEVMYYNASLVDPILKANGWLSNDGSWENPTWEQVFTISEYINNNKETLKYTYKNAEYSVDYTNMSYPTYVDSEANFFITTSRQWGGEGKYTVLNSDGTGKVVAYNNSNKTAQEYFLAKATNKSFNFPAAGGTGSYGSSYMAVNKAFISVGSTAGAKNNASTRYEMKTTTYPQKGYTASDTNAVIQQGTNLAILSKASDDYQMMAAWLLIKYLTNAENQVYFSTNTGYLPVRQSARESQDFKDLLAAADSTNENYIYNGMVARALTSALKETSYYYTDPAFNGSSVVRDELETLVRDMYLYNKTYEEAMTIFYTTLTKSRITCVKES